MVYRVSSVLKMPGYRSHGAKSVPAPNVAKNTEIRDHQWRRVVLAGSSVKNAKDMGPPIQKMSRSHYCGNPKDAGPPMEKISAQHCGKTLGKGDAPQLNSA